KPQGAPALPSFRMQQMAGPLLNELPIPSVPVGLDTDDQGDVSFLSQLPGQAQLQALIVENAKLSPADLKVIGKLKQLQALNLRDTQIGDADLKELAHLQELQILALDRTQVTDVGMKELTGLQKLRQLGLGKTRISDAGLREVAKLKK